jgi:hypothetical protein
MAYIEVPPTLIDGAELVCDNEYHDLAIPIYEPEVACSTDAHTYFNISKVTVRPMVIDLAVDVNGVPLVIPVEIPGEGRLRIRMVREPWNGSPSDPTYYFDLPLKNGTGWLDTRSMFETAEDGRPLKWQYRVTGASTVSLGTHFVKYRQNLGKVTL